MSARARVLTGGLIFLSILGGLVHAQAPKGLPTTREEFEAKLGYKTGQIALSGGMATINLPASFRFLGPEGAKRLLTEGWGNPAQATEGVLGMLVPTAVSPLTPEGWGIVITYDEDGFVNDDDAASIDYTKMLKEMQDGMGDANEERQKQGFQPITLVGWAEQPSYDRSTHKLYWAKELMFGQDANHTLNYNIRILGRRGVLVLNAVAQMDQLPAIRKESRSILEAVDFNEGHRYSDYVPGADKAAAYGVAGLVLGAAAVKTGIFKMIWLAILAFKKVIVVGFVALGAFLKKLFARRSSPPSPGPARP